MDSKELIPQKIKETLILKSELRKLNEGKDLLDNYGWREYAMWDAIRRSYSTIDLLVGRTGPDFKCPEINIFAGEMKSGQFDLPKTFNYLTENKGSGEFDKQTDPIRRKETLEYDGFIFGLFLRDYYTPIVLLFIHSQEGVYKMREILKHKQSVKIMEIEELEKINKKAPRDSIVVKFKDIYDNLGPSDYSVMYHGSWMATDEYIKRLRNNQLYLPNL